MTGPWVKCICLWVFPAFMLYIMSGIESKPISKCRWSSLRIFCSWRGGSPDCRVFRKILTVHSSLCRDAWWVMDPWPWSWIMLYWRALGKQESSPLYDKLNFLYSSLCHFGTKTSNYRHQGIVGAGNKPPGGEYGALCPLLLLSNKETLPLVTAVKASKGQYVMPLIL